MPEAETRLGLDEQAGIRGPFEVVEQSGRRCPMHGGEQVEVDVRSDRSGGANQRRRVTERGQLSVDGVTDRRLARRRR